MNPIIEDILRREGGYVNNTADRGGPTKYGITQATLAGWRGSAVTEQDVRNLTQEEAVNIYEAQYVAPFARFSNDQGLLALCVDSAVQHGVGRVQEWLQAIPSTDPNTNYCGLLRRRLEFYGEIITSNPSQAAFAKGWLARAAEFVR